MIRLLFVEVYMISTNNHNPLTHSFIIKHVSNHSIQEVRHEQVFYCGTVDAFSKPSIRAGGRS
jgi:hypothetical protein